MKPRRISPGIGGPNSRMIGLRPILGSKCFQPAGLNVGPSGYDGMIMDGRLVSDSDALAFITAASISDSTQQTAIYFLVGALKDTGLWTKMTACYPFVGGNATAHSKDLKAAYNITWAGTALTHNSNGVTGNGAGYGNTGINPNSVMTANTVHACTYERTLVSSAKNYGVAVSSNFFVFGGYDNSTQDIRLNCLSSAGVATRGKPGVYISTRNSSQICNAYSNGAFMGNSASLTDGKPNGNIFMFARNVNGSPADYTSNNNAFLSIGTGLSFSDAVNLSMIVQSYQTILGRAV